MNIEFLLILSGSIMCGLFAWRRFARGPRQEDIRHLGVLANLGCLFVIIGFGSLIIESLSSIY